MNVFKFPYKSQLYGCQSLEFPIGINLSSLFFHQVVEWLPKVWQHVNKFIETHNATDATMGPRQFLSCPMDVAEAQAWFTELWNYSLVPYLQEAIKEGLQVSSQSVRWVVGLMGSPSISQPIGQSVCPNQSQTLNIYRNLLKVSHFYNLFHNLTQDCWLVEIWSKIRLGGPDRLANSDIPMGSRHRRSSAHSGR